MSARINRRAVLGAAAALPVVTLPVAAHAADRSAWDAAVASHRNARKAIDRFDAEVYKPACKAHSALRSTMGWPFTDEQKAQLAETGVDGAQKRLGDLSSEHLEALDALFETPAPDLPDVVYKLEWYQKEEAAGLIYAEAWIDCVIVDLKRLAGQETADA